MQCKPKIHNTTRPSATATNSEQANARWYVSCYFPNNILITPHSPTRTMAQTTPYIIYIYIYIYYIYIDRQIDRQIQICLFLSFFFFSTPFSHFIYLFIYLFIDLFIYLSFFFSFFALFHFFIVCLIIHSQAH